MPQAKPDKLKKLLAVTGVMAALSTQFGPVADLISPEYAPYVMAAGVAAAYAGKSVVEGQAIVDLFRRPRPASRRR